MQPGCENVVQKCEECAMSSAADSSMHFSSTKLQPTARPQSTGAAIE